MPRFLLFLILSIFIAVAPAPGQQTSTKLIVRVDDMGFSHSANQAILKTLKDGIGTSVEIMVPAPWFPEVVALLKDNPQVDVGIHLTLTSEWSNMKYRPISNSPSLTNKDGYFHPFIWPNKDYTGQALSEHEWKIEEVEKEFRAQIALAKKHLPNITHISAHMGCYNLNPELQALAKRLAKEYDIDIDPADYSVIPTTYHGPKESSEQKILSFIKMLEKLEAGKTYLFVDHPGFDTPELRAIHHIGYEDVAVDRQGVTDTLTDPRVREAIRKLGVQLISYADLVE